MDIIQTEPTGNKRGASIAIIIVILIVALGGAYFWYTRIPTKSDVKTNTKVTPSVSATSLQNQLDTIGTIDIDTEMKELDQVYK